MKLSDWLSGWRESKEPFSNWPDLVMKSFKRQFKKNYFKKFSSPYNREYYFKKNRFEYKIVVSGKVRGGSYHYYKRLIR